MDIFFYFSLSQSNLDFLVIFMFIYAFTHFFINCKFNSGMLKMSDRKPILSQARQMSANLLKVCKEQKQMHNLYRERVSKLTCTSTTTLSHIEAEPKKVILLSLKTRNELDDSLTSGNEMYGIKKIQPTL